MGNIEPISFLLVSNPYLNQKISGLLLPEGLKAIPEKLMDVFSDLDERNIKSWPDSLIGRDIE